MATAQEIVDDLERRIAKDNIRFGVCRKDGKHSGIWTAFGSSKGDYYIGARSIMGSTKISLHASGVCRLALTETQMKLLDAQDLEQPTDRAFVKWRRATTPASGAVHVASVLFPLDYLHLNAPQGTAKKPIFLFEASEPGHAVEFGFFSRMPTAALEQKLVRIGKPLFRTDLDNGESVSMVVRLVEFDPNVLPTSDRLNKGRRLLLDGDALPEPGTEEHGLTAALWNKPKDRETLRIIEIGGITLARAPEPAPAGS
jgi:hypothetical protein